MEEDLIIGDLSFDSFASAEDIFANFILKLDEDREFASGDKKERRDDPTRTTMLALYNASDERLLFASDLDPSHFRVIRDGYDGRKFVAEYTQCNSDDIVVKFNYRECLKELFSRCQTE
jgi:hypothetical protein